MQKDIRNPYYDKYEPISKGGTLFIPIGMPTLSKMTNDFETRRVTVITGPPKEGKSSVVHQIYLNSVDKGFGSVLLDGEHDQSWLLNTLYRKVIGVSPNTFTRVPYHKKYILEPTQAGLDMLMEWHKDRMTIISKYLMKHIDTLDQLFTFIGDVVVKYKCKLLILDNLMTLVEGTQAEKNENQSRFVKRVCELAKSHNIHCIIVAHPNKGAIPGGDMGIYDVSGASEIVNLVDFLIHIKRNYEKNEEDEPDGWARLLLNRPWGEVGDVPLRFDTQRRTLYEMNGLGNAISYDFNWQGKGKQIQL